MAVATTPYQQNDYQAANSFRPYRLPVNDIMKASTAINAYWDAGAARVKGVYDNAVDLQLSLEPNKQLRDQYLKDSQVQLQKLSSMDLSDPDVQREGIAIFKPLFSDEGIMSDDQATRHIERINSDALSFRNKDEGKGYSSVNHQYALTGANEFKNSKDRMAGKAYLQTAKNYELFYDPKSELTSILKSCKPDKLSSETTQGYYINGYSVESLSAAKINSCLDAGLSDKAKRQIEINGAVTYRGQPQALRDKYLPHLQGTRSQLSEQKAAIQGILANKDNLKNLKKEDLAKIGVRDASEITPDFIKSLQETVHGIDDRIININQTVGKLQSNDFSPITGGDFERIAGTVYSRDYMQNIAEGFDYDFQTNTKKADPVQKMFFDAAQINARQEDDQAHDLYMQEIQNRADLMEKLLSGKGLKGTEALLNPESIAAARIQNATDNPFSTTKKNDNYEEVTQKRVDLERTRSQIKQSATIEAKTYGLPANLDLDTPEGKQWISNFEVTAKGDPTKMEFIQRYKQQVANVNVLDTIYKSIQDNVDAEVAPMEAQSQATISNIAPISIDGVTITGKDIYNAISGKGGPFKVVIPPGFGTIENPLPGADPKFYYNGKEIIPRYGQPGFELQGTVFQAAQKNDQGIAQIRKKRNELMAEQTILQREGYNFPQINDKDNNFKKRIAQELEVGEKYIDKIKIGQTDLNGNLIVTLSPQGKNEEDYDFARALKKLKNYGGRDNQVTPGVDNQVVIQGIQELDLVDENSLTSMLPAYMRTLERGANRKGTDSTPYLPSVGGREYKMVVIKAAGGNIYKIVDKEKPTSPIVSFTSQGEALQNFETILKK